jgi:Holliday junction resolvase
MQVISVVDDKPVSIPYRKEPNRYLIGKRYELELTRKLYKYGFAVIRAPASGRRAKRVPYPDIVAIKHRNVLVISVKYRSKLGTIYVSQDELRKMMDFAIRADGIMLVAIKVRELGDWRVIPLSTGTSTSISTGKVTITVDMVRNAKRLEDWLRESNLLY